MDQVFYTLKKGEKYLVSDSYTWSKNLGVFKTELFETERAAKDTLNAEYSSNPKVSVVKILVSMKESVK
jgi:hypothetical protein